MSDAIYSPGKRSCEVFAQDSRALGVSDPGGPFQFNIPKLQIPRAQCLNFAKKVPAQVVAVIDRHFEALLYLNIALHYGGNQFVRINMSEQAPPSP